MPEFIDLTGDRYGRLTVIGYAGHKGGRTAWRCRCDCGNEVITTGNQMRRGKTRSCGCLADEIKGERARQGLAHCGEHMIRHGLHGSRLYLIWKAMRQRCNDTNSKDYPDYGGRGINVCSEWNDFKAFYNWAMAAGYKPDAAFGECTLDRIDNSQGYRPDNCRWVSLKVQANNRRKRKEARAC